VSQVAKRLRSMGIIFVVLGLLIGSSCYWLSYHPLPAPYWLQDTLLPTSGDTRTTYYVFSSLFLLMGLCCFGGAWQRRHLIRE
jgi:hypothetical protein